MGNLIETIMGSGKLKGVTDAIKIGGLVDLLSTDGPYTLLCPHDEAFAQIPKSFYNSLLENRNDLAELVKCHIIKGNITSKDIEEKLKGSDSVKVDTLGGREVVFKSSGTLKHHFTVNSATIVSSDLRAENGIVHIIDKVLFMEEEN